MKPLTREWVDKAEGAFATARRELRVRVAPNYDAVCFHAQQGAEKYLKARLQESGTPFGRTHDLLVLAAQVGLGGLGTHRMRARLAVLNAAAVAFVTPVTRPTSRRPTRPWQRAASSDARCGDRSDRRTEGSDRTRPLGA